MLQLILNSKRMARPSLITAPVAALVMLTALGCANTADQQEQPKPLAAATGQLNAEPQIDTYATLVHRSYLAAREKAVAMRQAIDAFLARPNDKTLLDARVAWLEARQPYGETEAFRFYEGPIDRVDPDTNEAGPEGRLNAWPLNEAFIDGVKGNPHSGIIHDTDVPITAEALTERNAVSDEKNVTTGYHAIEFLLWGQDFNPDGPGQRPASDFEPGDPIRERRRQYLKVVTDLLIDDLKSLVDAWGPNREDNYAAQFRALDDREALRRILTGLATLSGFELASERIAVPLDSGDQEDEHSCFSDNTHNDYIANQRGIMNVYFGEVGTYSGDGINALVDRIDPSLNQQIESRLLLTMRLIEALDYPIDQVLASEPGSPGRQKLEKVVTSLQAQADLFVQLGERLGVPVVIAGE